MLSQTSRYAFREARDPGFGVQSILHTLGKGNVPQLLLPFSRACRLLQAVPQFNRPLQFRSGGGRGGGEGRGGGGGLPLTTLSHKP